MAVITLKVSEEEKLIREKTLSSLEDEYDAKIADMKLEEYEKYLASGGKVLNWDEL